MTRVGGHIVALWGHQRASWAGLRTWVSVNVGHMLWSCAAAPLEPLAAGWVLLLLPFVAQTATPPCLYVYQSYGWAKSPVSP
jgi:hypothetical protein